MQSNSAQVHAEPRATADYLQRCRGRHKFKNASTCTEWISLDQMQQISSNYCFLLDHHDLLQLPGKMPAAYTLFIPVAGAQSPGMQTSDDRHSTAVNPESDSLQVDRHSAIPT